VEGALCLVMWEAQSRGWVYGVPRVLAIWQSGEGDVVSLALDGAGGTIITVKGYLVKSWEAQVSY
jgi:hypothetical protein